MKAIAAFAILSLCLCSGADERIASLAPSVTETLFAIGAGPEVVGVSRYCRFPAQVQCLPKTGGFIDPDFEAVIRLKPTLVAMTNDNPKAEARLKALGLRTTSIRNRDVKSILDSYIVLGEACGHLKEAKALVDEANLKLDSIRSRAQGLPRPKVLVCMGRSIGGGVKEVFAAGPGTGVYSELIGIAGGENICGSVTSKAPSISAEGVIRLDPEVIIDLAPPGADVKAMLADWAALKQVSAVKSGRVYVLTSDYAQIPGPRFLLTLEDIFNCVHPEAKASAK